MLDQQIRQCRKCGETKPITGFPLCSSKSTSQRRVCQDCTYRRVRQWIDENRDRYRKKTMERYHANPSAHWTPERRKRANELAVARSRELRDAVFGQYGPECVACGETEPLFLTLDHVENDGVHMRKVHGTGQALYRWVIKQGYPQSFQVLCMNCNFGKARNGGVLVRDRRRDKGRFNDYPERE